MSFHAGWQPSYDVNKSSRMCVLWLGVLVCIRNTVRSYSAGSQWCTNPLNWGCDGLSLWRQHIRVLGEARGSVATPVTAYPQRGACTHQCSFIVKNLVGNYCSCDKVMETTSWRWDTIGSSAVSVEWPCCNLTLNKRVLPVWKGF